MIRYCSSCGKEITEGTKFCPSCGKAVVYEAGQMQSHTAQQLKLKKPEFAAILSFIVPGLGQIYNDQFRNGIIIFMLEVMAFFVLPPMFRFPQRWGSFPSPNFFTVYFLIWIYAIYEAYTTAQKINRGEIKV